MTLKAGGEISVWEQFGVPDGVVSATIRVAPDEYDDPSVGTEFICDESLEIGVPEADS